MSDAPEYVHERTFDAPRSLVWRAWSDPEILSRWYGPGVETIIHAFELKPGGVWRNEMKWGEKSDLSQMSFLEVVPEEKITWHHSSTDADWNVISNPMMADWPRVLLATVTFEDDGSGTKVRLSMVPVEASEAETACFAAAMAGMDGGWGKGFEIMAEVLTELQA